MECGMSRQLSRWSTFAYTHMSPPRRGLRTDYAVPKAKGYTYFNDSKTGAYQTPEIPYTFDFLWTDVGQPFDDTD